MIRIATTDPLTGIVNRRQLMRALVPEQQGAQRDKIGFALRMLDIGRFNPINDTYGHPMASFGPP